MSWIKSLWSAWILRETIAANLKEQIVLSHHTTDVVWFAHWGWFVHFHTGRLFPLKGNANFFSPVCFDSLAIPRGPRVVAANLFYAQKKYSCCGVLRQYSIAIYQFNTFSKNTESGTLNFCLLFEITLHKSFFSHWQLYTPVCLKKSAK